MTKDYSILKSESSSCLRLNSFELVRQKESQEAFKAEEDVSLV